MSKIVYFTILSLILLAALTVINIRGVNASEATKFVPVPVLAQDQADYGVDQDAHPIPAVSPAIIEDKVQDMNSVSEIVQTIEYTTIPITKSGPADEGNSSSPNVYNPQTTGNPGNNGNTVTNQNQNTNQNANGQNKDKNKGQDSGKNKGNKGNSGGNATSGNETGRANTQSNNSAKDK